MKHLRKFEDLDHLDFLAAEKDLRDRKDNSHMTTTKLNTALDLRDHGVAVYNGYCRSLKPWRDPASGRDYIYAGIFTTPALVVQLDVATGRCRQFTLVYPRMTRDSLMDSSWIAHVL